MGLEPKRRGHERVFNTAAECHGSHQCQPVYLQSYSGTPIGRVAYSGDVFSVQKRTSFANLGSLWTLRVTAPGDDSAIADSRLSSFVQRHFELSGFLVWLSVFADCVTGNYDFRTEF